MRVSQLMVVCRGGGAGAASSVEEEEEGLRATEAAQLGAERVVLQSNSQQVSIISQPNPTHCVIGVCSLSSPGADHLAFSTNSINV